MSDERWCGDHQPAWFDFLMLIGFPVVGFVAAFLIARYA